MLNDVMSTKEAAERFGVAANTVQILCTGQKGFPPRLNESECQKSGGTWLVTRQGMERLYGAEKK